ncbi:MAG: nitrogen regulation protein NR(II) [Porticoccaceae bacterium]|jgi:two-component system nitrogen regulation sensor histidine kinase GlnL
MNQDVNAHLLLDSLTTAVMVLDDSLLIQYLNPSAETLLAASAARLHGSSAAALFSGMENRLDALYHALKDDTSFTERKAAMSLADQSQVIVDYSVTPLTVRNARILLIEMQPMERIMRIDREEALISAHDTSRNLIRGLAHEIKNPLGGIQGAAQLLAEELDSEELREYTAIITTEVERLRNLVDRLLGPNKPAILAPVNIHEVTEHVATLLEAETRDDLPIIRDYDPSIPEIHGDREQLIQAVLNVARNAMQSLSGAGMIGRGGCIRLRTRIQRHFTIGRDHHRVVCRLDIIDNGPGIPAEIGNRIFYPMISGRAEGSGLGLPIAQSAISLHRGLIECDSRQGYTQFSIFLPIDNDHE